MTETFGRKLKLGIIGIGVGAYRNLAGDRTDAGI